MNMITATNPAVRRDVGDRGPAIIVPCGSMSEHWLSVDEATGLRDELTAALTTGSELADPAIATDDNPPGANARIAALAARSSTLASALTALIARVRRSGGYASPEEQDVLRAAELALAGGEPWPQTAGGAEKPPGVPQERAEGAPAMAVQSTSGPSPPRR